MGGKEGSAWRGAAGGGGPGCLLTVIRERIGLVGVPDLEVGSQDVGRVMVVGSSPQEVGQVRWPARVGLAGGPQDSAQCEGRAWATLSRLWGAWA